jgi:lipopolysaccharide transport system ATP-binding protein
MQPAIRVEGLSKRYRLGGGPRGGYGTLAETLVTTAAGLARRLTGRATRNPAAPAGEFWALKDVSFEVRPGEVVGIIGRNGAGKSTLLKILSRIVEPTAGRAEVRGRLGSLLEVGTGFHPELSGRENVYLNGSMLGMTRREIARKFDEIAAFSGVEAFLDTPVKRYSSGMFVRLAFAVTAHLEPEILVVDEVLAVGDAAFQRRCFEKMEHLRRSGRTVLVVSHNLGAILSLCTRAINLEHGKVMSEGPVDREVTWYLTRLRDASRSELADRQDRDGDQKVRLVRVAFRNGAGREVAQPVSGEELRVVMTAEAADPDAVVDYVALSCWTSDGAKVFHVDNTQTGRAVTAAGRVREYVCRIPRLPLPPGLYHWNAMLAGGGQTRDHVYAAAATEVQAGDFYRAGRAANAEGGLVLLDHEWA